MTKKAGSGSNPIAQEPGYKAINKFGVNLDIDTTTDPETIWAQGGVFPFLAAGITMDFLSTGANAADDTLLGTGAQKLRITFYDDLNVEFIQDFETAGATPVQLPGIVKLVSRIEVIQTGSGMTNAGKITVVNRGGGIIHQSVEVGEDQTLSTPQMVPAGKKGKIKSHYAGYARAGAAFNNADMRFRIRLNNGTFLTKYPIVISPNHAHDIRDYGVGGIEMEAGDIAFWECIEVSAADTPILAGFDIEFTDI